MKPQRNKHFCLVGLLVLASQTTGVAAQPAPAAAATDMDVRLWAASCAACHGTHGKAEGAGMRLAGRPAADLYASLSAYKNGSRPATVMHQHAKGYSDAELKKLADHFSTIK